MALSLYSRTNASLHLVDACPFMDHCMTLPAVKVPILWYSEECVHFSTDEKSLSCDKQELDMHIHTGITAVGIFISGLGTSILLFTVEICWRFYNIGLEREEPYSTDTESTTGEILPSWLSVESVSTLIMK